MTLKSHYEKHTELEKECGAAWDWLRKLPTYKKAYGQFKKLDPTKKANAESSIREKWGFFPLEDPKIVYPKGAIRSKSPPIDFFSGVCHLFGFNPVESGFDPVELNRIALNCVEDDQQRKYWKRKDGSEPPRELPLKLRIEINPRVKASQIAHEVERYVMRVQKAYGVNTNNRPRGHGLYNKYRALVWFQMGYSEKEIKRNLQETFEYMGGNIDDDSKRKAVGRILRDVKAISDK